MNFGKKCPLLILLLVSGFIISAVSRANLDGSYRDFEKETVMTPVLAAFFQGLKEEQYPWPDGAGALARADDEAAEETFKEGLPEETMRENAEGPGGAETGNVTAEDSAEAGSAASEGGAETGNAASEDSAEAGGAASEGGAETGNTAAEGGAEAGNAASEGGAETGNAAAEGSAEAGNTAAEGGAETGNAAGKGSADDAQGDAPKREESAQEDQNVLEGEETSETERIWELGRVEEDYFDDALFIGDSRTQGLYEYGGFSENVTFYCKTSLTVYDLFKKNKAFIKEGDRKLTLEEALTEHSFGKIYLMIGINEMGTGTAESFFEEYARAVYRIQQLQPDAVIFVQAIMRVGAQKNASDPIFNNMNIAVRNVEIETLADDQRIFYIDVNEVFCDENGNLFEGWSNDQIHLKAKYYAVWKEYLLNHGAVQKG